MGCVNDTGHKNLTAWMQKAFRTFVVMWPSGFILMLIPLPNKLFSFGFAAVLPKFEVTVKMPKVITILDEELKVTVCGL